MKANNIDREYRDLARLAHQYGHKGIGFGLYLRGRTMAVVLGLKVGHDALFLTAAFIFGHVTRWVWLE